MDNKILLKEFDGKSSSNTSEGVNVQFKGRRKLLPLNDVSNSINQFDQYMKERSACNKIRLTCQVNPICSNVLFNGITEIVKDEGSSGVSFINYGIKGSKDGTVNEDEVLFENVVFKPKTMEFWKGGIQSYLTTEKYSSSRTIKSFVDSDNLYTRPLKYLGVPNTSENSFLHSTNSIRDTQLSNTSVGFKYHCGFDIFNNHLIRSNTFKTVCKLPDGAKWDDINVQYEAFNTIADIMRDVNGNKVFEKICFPITASVPNNSKVLALHLYEYDDVYTFEECAKNRLIKKYNGWVGFENKSKIKSYADFANGIELSIERPLMYINGGDFVDMYPGRDLYSFVPKYNEYRKRIEKNWNYCITYPSSSFTPSDDSEPFNEIFEHNLGLNSLKAVYFNENTRGDNGLTQLVIYSVSKHGLSVGDNVNIYKTYMTNQYWVYDVQGTRISQYYTNKKDAEKELSRLKEEQDLDCGYGAMLNPSGVSGTTAETLFNEVVISDAEVGEVVNDYIFTVFNSNIRISDEWIELTKSQLNSNDKLTIGDRYFIVDKFTRKFLTEVDEDNEPLSGDNTYYIVNDSYVNIDKKAQRISFKKTVGGIECDYYIRIFSKLPNFKYASGNTLNEYELYKNNGEIINEYQDKKYDFENHISKLAFSKNIYTDEVGELIFTDDIDISNLHDNLGRPLSSLYLTFIKNNKGYKEWYGYDHNSLDENDSNNWNESEIGDSYVEYSHAFGKITCGIETSYEANYGAAINCINRITNVLEVNSNTSVSPQGFNVGFINNQRAYENESGKKVDITDNEIWYDTDKHFYGDLCCFDNYNAIEKHISYIMHRFNTAQREVGNANSNRYFKNYVYDEIHKDDYDTSDKYEIKSYISKTTCGNKKEGYYYNPHYEIPIRSFGKLESIIPSFLKIREVTKNNDGTYRIVTLKNHFLSIGDKAILYYILDDTYYELVTVKGENDNYKVFTCKVYEEGTHKVVNLPEITRDNLWEFKLFKIDNLDCPSYARVLKDGTCRVVWRELINNGVGNGITEIEEYPFTNGAFYINKKVDIYVRRQDPYDEYHLYSDDDIEGLGVDIVQEDNYVKENDIEC